jgi:hypothetical protein
MKTYKQIERFARGMAEFAMLIAEQTRSLMSLQRFPPTWLALAINLPADLMTGYRIVSLS